MTLTNNEVKIAAKELFESLLNTYQNDKELKFLVSYFGEFSQDLVNSLSEGIEENMLTNGAKKNLTKRMFSVLMEGLQNLRIHGEKDVSKKQIGHLIITEKNSRYNVSIGNLCFSNNVLSLTSRLEKLNQMSADKIRAYYNEILSNSIMSDRGGAGLGFITIRFKSKSQLNYTFEELNSELSYFTINISLTA